ADALERKSKAGRLQLGQEVGWPATPLESGRQDLAACESFETALGRAVDPEENGISVHRVSVPQTLEMEKGVRTSLGSCTRRRMGRTRCQTRPIGADGL